MSVLTPEFTLSPSVRVLINVGGLMDIPTGFYVRGRHGESILNGGLGALDGVVAIGNNGKSTLMHYRMLSAAEKIAVTCDTSLHTYDTETNTHEGRLHDLTRRFPVFANRNILNEGMWTTTDKTVYLGNEWYEVLKSFLKNKRAQAKKILRETPFLERDKKTLLSIPVPTFCEIDSLTDFQTADVMKMGDDNELGDSGGNTMSMRQGAAKARLLLEIPALAGSAYHFMLMSAQINKKIVIPTGPIPQAPTKQLQQLKNNDVLIGVTNKFTYVMSNCWHIYNSTALLNKTSRTPEYPRHPEDNAVDDPDLNLISIRQLRGKSGPTACTIKLVLSQSEGILPELSEFHYLRDTMKYYGLSGGSSTYALDLLPDVKLSRPTVRAKIDSDPLLRRALNITAELCQIRELWRHLDPAFVLTPAELYENLRAQGYDWTQLLQTRGWWTLDNDSYKVPFLSTMDLLNMASATRPPSRDAHPYFPYWMNPDKTLKPGYVLGA